MQEQQYLDFFHAQRDQLDTCSCDMLNAHRDEALAAFQRLGFPSQKVERYKYTDVAAAFAPNYGISLRKEPFLGDFHAVQDL